MQQTSLKYAAQSPEGEEPPAPDKLFKVARRFLTEANGDVEAAADAMSSYLIRHIRAFSVDLVTIVAAVWKRLGLAVIDGGRQRRVADADMAALHGYSPERRAVAWNVAEGIVRAQVRSQKNDAGEKIESIAIGPYGQIYLDRKKVEMAKEGMTPKHADNRARRYMTKCLFRDMAAEWRRIAGRAGAMREPEPLLQAHSPELLIAAE